MTYSFCTLFDKNYLTRGLALHGSLLNHCHSFRLWILCMDNETYNVLQELNLKNVELIEFKDFEDQELLTAKKNRSIVEYYFTCKSSLLLYILKNNKDIKIIAYLDADLFFYSSPKPIYKEFGNNSIMIIPHRFLPSKKHQEEINGIYNAGVLIFKNNSEGIKCLQWWRNRCNECCDFDIQAGKVGDQKYLDEFPKLFKNVHILEHKGANTAQWNIRNYTIKKINNVIYIDNYPLIFYHFFHFKIYSYSRWLPPCPQNYYTEKTLAYKYLYKPYIRAMKKAQKLYPFSYGAIQRPSLIKQLAELIIPELKNIIKQIPGVKPILFHYRILFSKICHGKKD